MKGSESEDDDSHSKKKRQRSESRSVSERSSSAESGTGWDGIGFTPAVLFSFGIYPLIPVGFFFLCREELQEVQKTQEEEQEEEAQVCKWSPVFSWVMDNLAPQLGDPREKLGLNWRGELPK